MAVSAERLFIALPCVDLQYVIVALPVHTNILLVGPRCAIIYLYFKQMCGEALFFFRFGGCDGPAWRLFVALQLLDAMGNV